MIMSISSIIIIPLEIKNWLIIEFNMKLDRINNIGEKNILFKLIFSRNKTEINGKYYINKFRKYLDQN